MRVGVPVRAGGALAAACVLLLAAGCGVPDSGPAIAVSTAPQLGYQENAQDGRTTNAPPDPATANSPADLVQIFLGAAGADPANVDGTVTQFFTPAHRSGWKQSAAGPTVVRVTGFRGGEKPAKTAQVEVTGEVVGVLTADGSIEPQQGAGHFDRTFSVVQVNSEWLIDNPPADTLLSTDGLAATYESRTIYFSRPDGQALVPDLRYMSKTVPAEKRPTLMLDWLLAGPAHWLGQAAVDAIPAGTRRRGNVVTDNGTTVVNLTSEASAARSPAAMAAQISWTLRPWLNKLQIRVEDRPLKVPGVDGTVQPKDAWNRFVPSTVHPDQPGYYVTGGRVVPAAPATALPSVLSEAGAGVNSAVLSAALSPDLTAAALVRTAADGTPQLWIGGIGHEPRGQPSFSVVSGLGGVSAIGRPSFLPGGDLLVVPADGRLYTVDEHGTLAPVAFGEGTGPAGVTSVAVSSDGGRLAMVAGGALYVASLLRQAGSGSVSVGRPRRLAADFTGLTQVAWSRETKVVVGGRGPTGSQSMVTGPRGGTWEISVDGATTDYYSGSGDDLVPAEVSALTTDPADDRRNLTVLLGLNGRVFQLYQNQVAAPGGVGTPPSGGAPFFPG